MKLLSIPSLATILVLGSVVAQAASDKSSNRNGCYEFDFYSSGLDRTEETYQETDFGAVSNIPFYDAVTDEQLGNIQFTQFNLPGDCYMTTGIFSFLDSMNQLSYSFTTCNGRGAKDIITGGAGDYVGAYGQNSLVSIASPMFSFHMDFCTPAN